MKKSAIGLLLSIILVVGTTASADQETGLAGAGSPASAHPRAVVDEPRFDFGTVLDGAVIVHDFVVRNSGDAPLLINKVKTVCGCTSVDYAREIQPAAEGRITIKAATRGYGGRVFSKPVTVFTNDPGQGRLTLHIAGKVDRFARIEPRGVLLKGASGTRIQAVVSITPEEKYPFDIVKTWSRNPGEQIECSLEKKAGGWLLRVNNLVETPGKYRDRIHLKTDSPELPDIVIHVRGMISVGKS